MKNISVHVTLPDRKDIQVTVAADDIVYAVVKRIKVNNKYQIVKMIRILKTTLHVLISISTFHTCYLIIYAFVVIVLCLLLILLLCDFAFQQATNINMADHELVYQGRVLKITDDLQQLNIVDGSELDLQGTLKLLKPREKNHEM